MRTLSKKRTVSIMMLLAFALTFATQTNALGENGEGSLECTVTDVLFSQYSKRLSSKEEECAKCVQTGFSIDIFRNGKLFGVNWPRQKEVIKATVALCDYSSSANSSCTESTMVGGITGNCADLFVPADTGGSTGTSTSTGTGN